MKWLPRLEVLSRAAPRARPAIPISTKRWSTWCGGCLATPAWLNYTISRTRTRRAASPTRLRWPQEFPDRRRRRQLLHRRHVAGHRFRRRPQANGDRVPGAAVRVGMVGAARKAGPRFPASGSLRGNGLRRARASWVDAAEYGRSILQRARRALTTAPRLAKIASASSGALPRVSCDAKPDYAW